MRHIVFRWVQWNLEHATQHGVSVEECEQIILSARYQKVGGGKYRAGGRGSGGRGGSGCRWCSQ